MFGGRTLFWDLPDLLHAYNVCRGSSSRALSDMSLLDQMEDEGGSWGKGGLQSSMHMQSDWVK